MRSSLSKVALKDTSLTRFTMSRALRGVPGRRPRLDVRKRQIVRHLLLGTTGQWALPQLHQLIKGRLGVSYQRTRLIQFLREAGFEHRAGAGWIRES